MIKPWLSKLANALIAASVFDDRCEVQWLMECTQFSYDRLSQPGETDCVQATAHEKMERFNALDALLATQLQRLKLPPDMVRDMARNAEEILMEGKVIAGRQVVWMILDHFKTGDTLSTAYGYDYILSLQWFGDKKVEEFLHVWRNVVNNLGNRLRDEELRDLLHAKMKHTEGLFKSDLEHYSRERANSTLDDMRTDYSYKYLMNCMNRQISIKREQDKLDAKKAALQKAKNGGGIPANPLGKGTGKGKTKAKPKAKPRTTDDLPSTRSSPGKPKGKGKGKGKRSQSAPPARGGGGAATGSGQVSIGGNFCYFHNAHLRGLGQACTRGNDCKRSHDRMPDDQFNKWKASPPGKGNGAKSRSPSPAPSPTQGKQFTKGGKRTGYNKLKGKMVPICCAKFRGTGTCDDSKCNYRHINEKQYNHEYERINAVVTKNKKNK